MVGKYVPVEKSITESDMLGNSPAYWGDFYINWNMPADSTQQFELSNNQDTDDFRPVSYKDMTKINTMVPD